MFTRFRSLPRGAQSLRDALEAVEVKSAYRIGDLMGGLELSGSLVRRRLETITFPQQNLNHREIRVECDLRNARSKAHELGFILDTVPLMRIPKAVYFELSLTYDNSNVALLSRVEDANAGAAHLIAHARERTKKFPPGSALTSIQRSCRAFPVDYEAVKFPTQRDRAEERIAALPDVGSSEWYSAAGGDADWLRLLTQYEESFLVMPSVIPDDDFCTFVLSYTEAKQWVGPRKAVERMRSSPRPTKQLSLRLNEVGRARSEHFRIEAPQGTVISSPTIAQLGQKDLSFRVRSSRNTQIIYVQNIAAGATRAATMNAVLSPATRGLVVPSRVLGLVPLFAGAALLLAGPSRDSDVSRLWPIAIFVPSLALIWLNRPSSPVNPIRDRLVRNWLRLSFLNSAVLAIMFLYVTVSSRFTDGATWGDTAVRSTLTAISLVIAGFLVYFGLRAGRIENGLKRAELGPAKGDPLDVQSLNSRVG